MRKSTKKTTETKRTIKQRTLILEEEMYATYKILENTIKAIAKLQARVEELEEQNEADILILE